MTIGIIGAMDEEIHLFKNRLTNLETLNDKVFEIYRGRYHNKEVVLVKSGIGKVNAAIAASVLINNLNVSTIINTGIAGSINHTVALGDIVISSDTQQYDVDVTAFGYKLGTIPRLGTSAFKADQNLIELCKKSVDDKIKCHIGRIVSGDRFVSSDEFKQLLNTEFDAYCVDMESAAVGQVCYLYNVPYVAIRCISDNADKSSLISNQDFETYTAEISAAITLNVLESM
ncbi:MAG: MTA/SAH nucleosidase [Clostridiales bacterium 38_11]|nr:MAG: MTA/SAH nucleosidase [Clostridiales bacterium 38_11]HBH12157.1 5'-methylthioadenosine/adenosylhomocysteine nucleosidase [Clostridiales bacterium]